jgi:non-homologous end joining protein Ku
MAAMAARAIWKGSISFGLMNIPIQVFSATQKEEYTSFNQLCDKGQYSDTYAKELEKLIEAKSKGKEVVPKQVEETPEETTDIIEALKASLKVKARPSTSSSTAAKAKRKMGIAVSK